MEILLNNPLTNLDSSTFQLVYICLIAALLIIGRLGLRSVDESASRPELPIPRHPDPYELAFLRGGAREVGRTAIFSLIERGYLQMRQGHLPTLAQAPHPPNLTYLTPLESSVFTHFAAPVDTAELFQPGSPLVVQVKVHCPPYEEILYKKELLTSRQMKIKAWGNIVILVLIIVVFGGYWAYAALTAPAKGIGGIFIAVLLGLLGIGLVVYLGRLPRLSERGRLYWEQLERAFHDLKVRPDDPGLPELAAAPYTNLTVAVSLFGSDALSGTAYSPFQQMFLEPDAEYGQSRGVTRLWERLVRR